MITVGIVMVLLSLTLPAIGKMRDQGRDALSASNLRQIGLAYTIYADENQGRPPVFYPPVPVWGTGDMQPVQFGEDVSRGWYFANANDAYYAFNPLLPPEVLRAPQNTSDATTTLRTGVTAEQSDFEFTQVLWADPEFWNPTTAYGPDQWNPQPMHRTAFPSSKSLAFQGAAFVDGRRDDYTWFEGWAIPTLWVDMSFSRQPMGELIPGVVNLWLPFSDPQTPPYVESKPLRNTRDGVLGRDR